MKQLELNGSRRRTSLPSTVVSRRLPTEKSAPSENRQAGPGLAPFIRIDDVTTDEWPHAWRERKVPDAEKHPNSMATEPVTSSCSCCTWRVGDVGTSRHYPNESLT